MIPLAAGAASSNVWTCAITSCRSRFSQLAATSLPRLPDRYTRGPAPAGSPRPPALDGRTARELEVLTLLGRGRSNAEIADELIVSLATVKTHVASILRKCDLGDRVQAVVL